MHNHRRTKRSRSAGLGNSLAEYGLLGALVTIACLASMQLLGASIVTIVNDSCNAISEAISGVMG